MCSSDLIKILNEENKKVDKSVTTESFNIYVSGIDTYGDISTRSRSDVNMVITVNPKTNTILLTSIPRDFYVQLNGTTGSKDKLTHAGLYGVDMSIKTIEDLLSIDIDYFLRVNFSTLVSVVDLIGGIDVYSDKGFRPWTAPDIYIPKGNVRMDGKTALAFSRERYAYVEGDRHRVQNQQDVISAIIKKMTTSTALLTKYTQLLDSISNSFETNINMGEVSKLMKLQLNKMPSWNIQKYSVNGFDSSNYTYTFGKQLLYVMEPDYATVKSATSYINNVIAGKEINITSNVESTSTVQDIITNDKVIDNDSSNTKNDPINNKEEIIDNQEETIPDNSNNEDNLPKNDNDLENETSPEESVEKINSYLVERIVKRLSALYDLNGSIAFIPSSKHDVLKQQYAGKLFDEIQEDISKQLPNIQKEVKEAFYDAANQISHSNALFTSALLELQKQKGLLLDVNIPKASDVIVKSAKDLNMTPKEVRLLEIGRAHV